MKKEIFKPTLVPLDNYLHSNICTREHVSEKVNNILFNYTLNNILENITELYIDKNTLIIDGKIYSIIKKLNKDELNILFCYIYQVQQNNLHFPNLLNLFKEKYRLNK